MILVVETTWKGLRHAPANASLLHCVAAALPHESVHFFSEEAHGLEVQRCLGAAWPRNLRCHAVGLAPPDAQPLARLRWEAALLKRAVTKIDNGGKCLIVTAAATGPSIAAANLLALWLGRQRFCLHHRLHGNLNELHGWRSRNPLVRLFDLRSALTTWYSPQARYLVLEPHIRDRLAAILPALERSIDVLPETISPAEKQDADPPPPPPVRVGYLGLGTRAKGFDLYLRLARALAPASNGKVEFHAVGNLHRELTHEDQSVLAQPLAKAPIPRQDFVQAAASLHYAVLPYQGNYYQWSASGTLVDAISLGKPIIATDFPFVKALFDRFGDVGFLCRGEAEMAAVLRRLPTTFEPRYHRQKQAILNARQDRCPAAGVATYRQIIEAGFPDFLPTCAQAPQA